MKLEILAGLISAIFLFVGCSKQEGVVSRPGHPDYVRALDEKLMDRAMQKAKDTHQEFISALRDRQPYMKGFAIKKPFAVGKDHEHIWLSEVSWNGTEFEATVDNEPVDTKEVKLGDRIKVKPAELSDWMFIDNGELKGGYTIRVLHYQSSPGEQEEFLKNVPFTVPPIDF